MVVVGAGMVEGSTAYILAEQVEFASALQLIALFVYRIYLSG
jgi:hypothetical protein